MADNETHVAPEGGRVSTAADPSSAPPVRPVGRYGTATDSFLGRHPFIRRHRWFLASSVAPLLAVGVFVATHHVEASADPEVICSSYKVVQTVGDIVREHVFASRAKTMLDPDQFGGTLADIPVEKDKPLLCSASFVPRLAFSKAALDDATRSGATSQLDGIHKDAVSRYSALLQYKVRDDSAGKLRVDIVEGLDAFDWAIIYIANHGGLG